ncbi:chitin binding domain-containing protein [Mycobacterium sp. NBC_00419]|uniref:chitin binding peritrophin-A domain-containing protein n=1 Tax=Mycobacterium sp. NBC_00419 TaxID=2975989 RepID=UPI002E231005
MRNLFARSTVAVLAAAPIAAVSLLGAGIGSADPLNCPNGQFWDPITNTCQTPRPADNCAPGDYWNPLSNACRPLGQL